MIWDEGTRLLPKAWVLHPSSQGLVSQPYRRFLGRSSSHTRLSPSYHSRRRREWGRRPSATRSEWKTVGNEWRKRSGRSWDRTTPVHTARHLHPYGLSVSHGVYGGKKRPYGGGDERHHYQPIMGRRQGTSDETWWRSYPPIYAHSHNSLSHSLPHGVAWMRRSRMSVDLRRRGGDVVSPSLIIAYARLSIGDYDHIPTHHSPSPYGSANDKGKRRAVRIWQLFTFIISFLLLTLLLVPLDLFVNSCHILISYVPFSLLLTSRVRNERDEKGRSEGMRLCLVSHNSLSLLAGHNLIPLHATRSTEAHGVHLSRCAAYGGRIMVNYVSLSHHRLMVGLQPPNILTLPPEGTEVVSVRRWWTKWDKRRHELTSDP